MKVGALAVGARLAITFEGTIAAIEPSGTAGVWLVIANANEGGAVLRVALTDREVLHGAAAIEIGDADRGRAQAG